jgi:hypothetical protein
MTNYTPQFQKIKANILQDCETIKEYIAKKYENKEFIAKESNLDENFENLKSNLKKLDNISQKMADKYIELYSQKCTHVSFLLFFLLFSPMFILRRRE